MRKERSEFVESGTLYVVSTPIGTLADLSERGAVVLREVDLIVAEDTRHTSRLLGHIGATTPSRSYHEHNERKVAPEIVRALQHGQAVALVSDAGTPGVSDPGYRLLAQATQEGIPLVPVPGASAVLAALVVSGLPCDRFVFEGFLPKKKGRQTRLRDLADEARTIVIYESPQRVGRTLAELTDTLGGERRAVVARELTKLHESLDRGTLAELTERYRENAVKGEVTLVVEGKTRRIERNEDTGEDSHHVPPWPGIDS